MHITVKQGIDNCYLAHQYEHPGYEEDRCAGLRTGNGEGEPIDNCKETGRQDRICRKINGRKTGG